MQIKEDLATAFGEGPLESRKNASEGFFRNRGPRDHRQLVRLLMIGLSVGSCLRFTLNLAHG